MLNMSKITAAAALLWILSLFCATVVAQDTADSSLLIYMVGSDLESEHGLASKDLEEIQQNYPSEGNVNVLICLGGASSWSFDIQAEMPAICTLDQSGLHAEASLSGMHITEAETLTAFLEYAYDHYPADNNALIFWNHGSGPLLGFGIDEVNDNDRLTLPEIRKAFSSSRYKDNNRFSWIGFDACLMGSLETAAILKPYAEYMIASEEVELPCGWDYSFVSMLGNGLTTEKLAEAIIYGFYDTTVSLCGGDPLLMPSITLALYDLSKTDELIHSINTLTEMMDTTLQFGGYATLARKRAGVERIGKFSGGLTTDLVDLKEFVQINRDIYPEQVSSVLSNLDAFVISHLSNNPEYSGVSIYFPYDDLSGYLLTGKQRYDHISFSEEYSEILNRFADEWLLGRLESTALLSNYEVDGKPAIHLNEELQSTYESGAYFILEKTNDNYEKVISSKEVHLEKGILTADYHLLSVSVVQEESGIEYPVSLHYFDDWGTQWVYQTPILLTRGQLFGENDPYESTAAIAILAVDKDSLLCTIVNAFYVDEDDPHGKNQVLLEDWEVISFFRIGQQPTYDQNGNLLCFDNWIKSGHYYGVELDAGLPLSFKASSLSEYNAELYIQFSVRDIHSNIWNSDLLLLQSYSPEPNQAYIHHSWKDMSEPLILTNNDIALVEMLVPEDDVIDTFQLRITNRSDHVLYFDPGHLAINGLMASYFAGFNLIQCGECKIIEIEFDDQSLSDTTPSVYTSLQMDYDLRNDDSFYNESLSKEMHWIDLLWVLDAETIRTAAAEEQDRYYSWYSLNSGIVYEDDLIMIESLPLCESTMDYSFDALSTNLYFKCTNKSDMVLCLKWSEGSVNEWMISPLSSKSLLPGCSAYLPLTVTDYMISAEENNQLELSLDWYNLNDDIVCGQFSLGEVEVNVDHDRIMQFEIGFSESEIYNIQDAKFETAYNAHTAQLKILINNTSSRSIFLHNPVLQINGKDASSPYLAKVISPGKKMWIEVSLMNDVDSFESVYKTPIRSSNLLIDVLDDHTKHKIDEIVIEMIHISAE